MCDDRPAAGEALQHGSPAVPRPAATVIVLRGGSTALEVLLVKRNPAQRFMGGAWVFPGGAVDPHEGEGDDAHRIAGVREVAEEASVVLTDPGALIRFSRWITPAAISIRFDTHFFLAAAPEDAAPRADGRECVAEGWFTPRAALDAHAAGEIGLVFPTIRHLEQLERFATADALLGWARGRTVEPVVPQVVMEGEIARVVLPGEPGHEAAPGPASSIGGFGR